MFNAKQFSGALTKIENSQAALDGAIEYAVVKDNATGNPDNLNRLHKAIEALPGYKTRKMVVSFITHHTIFTLKDNGNFGRVKGKKADDMPAAPLFSEHVAQQDADAKAKREATKAAKAEKAAANAKLTAGERLALAAEKAVADLVKKFGDDVQSDLIRAAIEFAAIRGTKHNPQAISGTESGRKTEAAKDAGMPPAKQAGAV